MARAGIVKEINTFTRGLITEANLLAFPESASVRDENWVLFRNGSRRRRLGLGFEANGQTAESDYNPVTLANVAYSVHEWTNVANDPTRKILVVQLGQFLYFFDATAEAITAAPLNQSESLKLTDIDETFIIQSANMSGNFVLVTGSKFINILDYDVDTDTVTQSAANIQVRDLFGVDDDLATDERPTTLSDAHKYNLNNQGWEQDKINSFFSSQGKYPSNADVVFLGRDEKNNFDPAELVKLELGNTPAAKGKFIIDPFDRGAQRTDAETTYNGSGYTGGTSQGGGGSSREPISFNPYE